MLPAAAYGAHDYTWTGDYDSAWTTDSNWSGGGMSDFPGNDNADDTATIADAGDPYVLLSNAVTNSVAWVRLDADAANAALELEIDASIPFVDVLLYGDSTYKATFDVDVAPTISGDLETTGLADIDIAADTTVGDELYVGYAAYTNYTTKLGANKLECGTLDIDATAATHNDHDTTLEVSAGTLDVSGSATLHASNSYEADATLLHSSGTLVVDDIDLRGGNGSYGSAIAHLDVASGSGLTISGDIYVSGESYVQCDANVSADALYVGSSSDAGNGYKTGSSTLTVDALIVEGSSSGNSYFTVSAGSLAVN